MQINPIQNFNFNLKKNTNNFQTNSIKMALPLQKDTVSFTSLKKSAFEGADLLIVNRYKAPIEKFNTNDDLQDWCKEKRKKEYDLPSYYMSKNQEASWARLDMFEEWQKYLDDDKTPYTESQKLLISHGLTQGIKRSNSTLPPFLNKEILKDTMEEIDEELKASKSADVNFNAKYTENLRESYLKGTEMEGQGPNRSGWVIIPKASYGSEEYEDSVKKMQLFSSKMWCTKSTSSEQYITKGDCHIYLDNGKAKVATRYVGDTIVEIQNDKNDADIEDKYLGLLLEHIEGEKLNFDSKVQKGAYRARFEQLQGNEEA